MKPLLILVCFAWVLPLAANDEPRERLAKVGTYAFGGTGIGGVISSGQKDYEEILGRKTALEDFKWILGNGTPAAKCYALNGIFVLDPDAYKKISSSLASDQSTVMVQSGCMVHNSSISSLLGSIGRGRYRTVPGEKSYPSPPNSVDELFLLMERKIPAFHHDNTPLAEALNQLHVEGKLKFHRVRIKILAPEKVSSAKLELHLQDVSVLDALKAACALSGLSFLVNERTIYIFDPNSGVDLQELPKNKK